MKSCKGVRGNLFQSSHFSRMCIITKHFILAIQIAHKYFFLTFYSKILKFNYYVLNT